MNERIKGLWWKARIGYNEQNCDPEVLAKFAELIVEECIEVFSKDMPDPMSPDYQLGTLNEVVNRVCNVAEHFGVEE